MESLLFSQMINRYFFMLKAVKNPVKITTEFGRVSVVCITNG